jgi:hypothetical protein
MVGIASVTGDHALLFPQGIAMAWGVWAAARPDWCRMGIRFALVPTICAIGGVWFTEVGVSRLVAEWAALTTAIAVMAVSRTAIGPALAAGVLPAVAGVHSWTYPLAVLVTTVVVLAGRPIGNRRPQPAPPPPVAAGPGPEELVLGLVLVWGIAAAWFWIVAAVGLPAAAAAPPLLAALFESVVGAPPGWRKSLRVSAVTVTVWVTGAVATSLAPSLAIAGVASMGVAALVMTVSQVSYSPAVAMALVPLLRGPLGAPGELISGAAGLVLAILVLFSCGAAAHRALGRLRLTSSGEDDGETSLGATGLRHAVDTPIAGSDP